VTDYDPNRGSPDGCLVAGYVLSLIAFLAIGLAVGLVIGYLWGAA
jgi:hypothetical protein